MSKAFYPTLDGHVGNLKKLSRLQLLEMIQRQENLIKKKAFLQKLADKGEKITQHLQVLKRELESRQQDASSGKTGLKDTENNENSVVSGINTQTSTIVTKESNSDTSETDNNKLINSTDEGAVNLEVDFEKLNMEEDCEIDTTNKFKHQYEIAVERAELHSKEQKKGYRRLNRVLNISKVEDLPSELRPMSSDANNEKTQKKISEGEESAAVPPKYRYDTSKVISLDESLQLQQTQKQKQEELQAQLAAQKLAQRLNIKLETYNPEGVDMSYRDRTARENIDSDDDDDDDNVLKHEGADMADILTSDTED